MLRIVDSRRIIRGWRFVSPINRHLDSNLKILNIFRLEGTTRAAMCRMQAERGQAPRITPFDVRVDQGTACHCSDRVDGRNALFAAPVRLSLRGRDRLKTVRDLQGDGAPPAEGDHQSCDGRNLARWALSGLGRTLVSVRLVPREIPAGPHYVRCARFFRAIREGFCRRSECA